MDKIIVKSIGIMGERYYSTDLAEQLTCKINENCPAGYHFKEIVESMSNIKEDKNYPYLLRGNSVIVIYELD